MSKWILGELVRIFHGVSTDIAAAAVDAIVERTVPLVWEVGGNLRVLQPEMTMKHRALVLLYHCAGPVAEGELVGWIEHSNASVFRRDVLRPAHKKKLLEYDARSGTVYISPLGIDYVESVILKQLDVVAQQAIRAGPSRAGFTRQLGRSMAAFGVSTMIPIFEQGSGNGIGHGLSSFLRRFDEICSEHLAKGRAKSFAFIFYDFTDQAIRKILRNQGVFA